jgi:hypothetical protein
MIRTIEVSRASEAKATYDYASVGVLSILEPLLGIINCSLPLLRPVLQKIIGMFSRANASNSEHSSRPSILYSIGTKRMRRKTDDPYQLDTFNTLNGDYSTEVGKSQCMEEGSESVRNLVEINNVENKISVKKDWNIEYNTHPEAANI